MTEEASTSRAETRDMRRAGDNCPRCKEGELVKGLSAGVSARPPLVLRCGRCGYTSVNGKESKWTTEPLEEETASSIKSEIKARMLPLKALEEQGVPSGELDAYRRVLKMIDEESRTAKALASKLRASFVWGKWAGQPSHIVSIREDADNFYHAKIAEVIAALESVV